MSVYRKVEDVKYTLILNQVSFNCNIKFYRAITEFPDFTLEMKACIPDKPNDPIIDSDVLIHIIYMKPK